MKTNRENLLQALQTVKAGLATKEMIEQSTYFAFANNRVFTYNDEISISYPTDDLGFTGAVKAEELLKLLTRLKSEEITIAQKGNELIIKSGKSTAGLSLAEEISLPVEEIGETGKWKKIPDDWKSNISKVIDACGHDMSRPVLTCVNIQDDGKLIGSDGYRCSRIETEPLGIDTVLVEAQILKQCIALDIVKVSLGNGWLHFKTVDKAVVSCRIFEDSYPETDKFFQLEDYAEIELPAELKDGLETAGIFAKKDHAIDEVVSISITKGLATIKAKGDYGWYKEKMKCSYKGEGLQFSISTYLLRDALQSTNTCKLTQEKILFEKDGYSYLGMLRVE